MSCGCDDSALREALAVPLQQTPGEIAESFHRAYESLAPAFGYRTREASAVPWDTVPKSNRDLMIATVRAVLFEPETWAAARAALAASPATPDKENER